jgi:hypothetical protein
VITSVYVDLTAVDCVQAYVYYLEGETWSLDTIFVTPEAYRPQHRYAGLNSVAINGDLAVVGAPGLEAVYVWERVWSVASINATANGGWDVRRTWAWNGPKRLRGLGFDYDVLIGKPLMRQRDFGASVALSRRTLVVGAPLGNQPAHGTQYVDLHRTEQEWYKSLATGEVHVYYKRPEVWVVRMKADVLPHKGSFELILINQGLECISEPISCTAAAESVQAALESCPNVGPLEVTRSDFLDTTRARGYVWSVSFISETQAIQSLSAYWDGLGVPEDRVCLNCTLISSVWSDDPSDTFLSYIADSSQEWGEQATIQASDRNPGDLFGLNVAIDGEQLIVTAPHSSSPALTTWDFETGTLQGLSSFQDASFVSR